MPNEMGFVLVSENVLVKFFHHYNGLHVKHRSFYIILGILVLFDSVLLASPNLLGKVGLIIYKYHYLRNFPRALLTISIVCGAFTLITLGISRLFEKRIINKTWTLSILYLLVGLVILYYAKLIYDFSRWSYSHTGWRFKSGVYLLPFILLFIVGYTIWLVKFRSIQVKPVNDDPGIDPKVDEQSNDV
jgi:hypothetical protein